MTYRFCFGSSSLKNKLIGSETVTTALPKTSTVSTSSKH